MFVLSPCAVNICSLTAQSLIMISRPVLYVHPSVACVNTPGVREMKGRSTDASGLCFTLSRSGPLLPKHQQTHANVPCSICSRGRQEEVCVILVVVVVVGAAAMLPCCRGQRGPHALWVASNQRDWLMLQVVLVQLCPPAGFFLNTSSLISDPHPPASN